MAFVHFTVDLFQRLHMSDLKNGKLVVILPSPEKQKTVDEAAFVS